MNAIGEVRVIARARAAVNRFWSTPRSARNWMLWGWRRLLLPRFTLHCWVVTRGGLRFYLGDDIIDDRILEEVLREDSRVYSPIDLDPSDVVTVLDIGSHHGFVAIYYAHMFPGCRVIAVEPDPSAVDLISRNLLANQMEQVVEIQNVALGDSDGQTELYVGSQSWASSTRQLVHPTGIVKVPTKTLRSIVGTREIAFLKCNAEGAEFDLVRQLKEEEIRPSYMIIMIHPEFGSADDLIRSLQSMGYASHPAVESTERPIYHFRFESVSRK